MKMLILASLCAILGVGAIATKATVSGFSGTVSARHQMLADVGSEPSRPLIENSDQRRVR